MRAAVAAAEATRTQAQVGEAAAGSMAWAAPPVLARVAPLTPTEERAGQREQVAQTMVAPMEVALAPSARVAAQSAVPEPLAAGAPSVEAAAPSIRWAGAEQSAESEAQALPVGLAVGVLPVRWAGEGEPAVLPVALLEVLPVARLVVPVQPGVPEVKQAALEVGRALRARPVGMDVSYRRRAFRRGSLEKETQTTSREATTARGPAPSDIRPGR